MLCLVLGGGGEAGSRAAEKSETNGGGGRGLAECPSGLGSALWGGAPGRRTGSPGSRADLCLALCARAEVPPRSKRRCVLERKQPYSGDEWCSGPDSEEDDKPIGATHSECW